MTGESSSREAVATGSPTRGKSGSSTVAALEFLRGLAALDVFLWHVLNSHFAFPHIPGLYFLADWSRESVITFFVLSGYVISLSQRRKHREAGPFFLARIKRIIPIYWVAIGLALLAAHLNSLPFTPWQFFGHLLFLQSYEGSFVPPLQANGPLWSLGTEFEFYALLTLVIYLRRPAILLGWWTLGIAAMLVRHAGYFSSGLEGLLLEFLALSPCWLLGYFYAGLGRAWRLSLPQAVALFGLVPAVAWTDFGSKLLPGEHYDDLKCFFLALVIAPLIHTLASRQLEPGAPVSRHGWLVVAVAYLFLAPYALTHPISALSTMIFMTTIPFLGCALGFLLASPGRPPLGARFRRVALFMGASSYALYAIHSPVGWLMFWLVPNHYLQFPALLMAVAAVVVVLEYVYQPWAAGWIDRISSRGKAAPPAAGSRI